MDNLRKPAAIDIVFLGYGFVLAEYGVGVFFSVALGLFVLSRSLSSWQVLLGVYLIRLGLNYVPMLLYAVAVANKETAAAQLAGELADKRSAMSKCRRQSLLLLVPLAAPLLPLLHRRR